MESRQYNSANSLSSMESAVQRLEKGISEKIVGIEVVKMHLSNLKKESFWWGNAEKMFRAGSSASQRESAFDKRLVCECSLSSLQHRFGDTAESIK